MDRKKLDDLRAKYAVAPPGDVHDPRFKKVVEMVFAGTDRRPKPYEGVATFLGAPLRLDAPAARFRAGLDVALVGVPMDLGVTNRAGARLGPRAVRAIERIGPYEHVLRIAPIARARGRRHRRRAVPQPLQPRRLPRRHRGVLRARSAPPAWCRCRSAATTRSAYPILKARRPRPAGRHGPHRRALRHGGRVRRRQVPSRRAVPPGGARRRARPGAHRSRSASAAAPNICGSSPTIAA